MNQYWLSERNGTHWTHVGPIPLWAVIRILDAFIPGTEVQVWGRAPDGGRPLYQGTAFAVVGLLKERTDI